MWASTQANAQSPAAVKAETISLLGVPLYPVQLAFEAKKAAEERVQLARAALATAPGSADAILWLGRQLAVAGQVREAVDVFTGGIAKFPNDARFYRHRGHRYVTLRQFDKAIADLNKASELVAGKPDRQEPTTADAKVMSSETLDYGIYYHLGLAYYLKGDFAGALPAYRKCLAVAKGPMGNDDQIAGSSDWLYMTLRRAGRADEAAKVLEAIVPGMKVKDDQNYYDRLMMYKGVKTPQEVMTTTKDPVSEATLAYGVANWHLYNGRKDEAKAIFERIIKGSNWMPFGLIAAEAELARSKDDAPAPDRFAPIRGLEGTWHGVNNGQAGQGTCERTYQFDLGGAMLAGRNRAVYPPQAANPKGEVHQDVGYFSYDKARKKLVLRQFHSEGFVNQYVGEPRPDGKTIVFETEAIENIAAGWRARETYRFIGPDDVVEVFELAAPGKGFELYSEAKLHRVAAATR